jgi:hypothetical protein
MSLQVLIALMSLQIFCFFGVMKEFQWESPSYSLSLTLLIICAGAAAAIGYAFTNQTKYHGAALLALFVITGMLFTNL